MLTQSRKSCRRLVRHIVPQNLIPADDVREHNMVRFVNGVPKYVWYSQHASGQAFKYEAVKKDKSGFRVSHFGEQDRLSKLDQLLNLPADIFLCHRKPRKLRYRRHS